MFEYFRELKELGTSNRFPRFKKLRKFNNHNFDAFVWVATQLW